MTTLSLARPHTRRLISWRVRKQLIGYAYANVLLHTALSRVAEGMGLNSAVDRDRSQASQVAAFVDDLVGRRRPARFEVTPSAWAALLAASHLQAAVAGNDLPAGRFVRSLEESFEARRMTRSRGHV